MSLRTLYRKMALSRDDDVDCDTPAFLIIRDTEGHVSYSSLTVLPNRFFIFIRPIQ